MREPIIPIEDVVYIDGFGHYYTDAEDKIAIPYYSEVHVSALTQQRDTLAAALKVCADQFHDYASYHLARATLYAGTDEQFAVAEKYKRNQALADAARKALEEIK